MRGNLRWIGILAALAVLGYQPDPMSHVLGDSLTWHICDGDFTLAQESAIEDGSKAWTAGSGEILRGAIWEFVRGSDRANSTCNPTNAFHEVYMRDATWFSDRGMATALAWCNCNGPVHDIAFKSGVAWSTSLPSEIATPGERPIGHIAVHEFGHSLGLNHEDDLIATMNTVYPNGGDLGSTGYRIHEDDYVGLVATRPDSSLGRNLMLSKFEPTTAGNSSELWTSLLEFCNQGIYDASDLSAAETPDEIFAVIEGTASSVTTNVYWWLSDDDDCQSLPTYYIAHETTTIGSNSPFRLSVGAWDFQGIPSNQSYYLCAGIDPFDEVTETVTAVPGDNVVQSDSRIITIHGYPCSI
jgi:hypothetical protein